MWVKCKLSLKGELSACEVPRRAPLWVTEAALASVRTRRFRPATYRERRVGMDYAFRLRFRLPAGQSTAAKLLAALEHAKDDVRVHPEDDLAWLQLAQLLARDEFAGHTQGVEPVFREAARRFPDPPSMQTALAFTLVRGGNFDEAKRVAERALSQEPTSYDALRALAAAEMGGRDRDAAIAAQRFWRCRTCPTSEPRP